MTSYTAVFGGSEIAPSQVSYLALALTADVDLQWPLEALPDGTLVAAIIDVTSDGAHAISMPDATQASPGTSVLFNNVSAYTITVTDSTGSTILSLTTGTAWYLYLRDNTTAAGSWRTTQFGASTSTAQAASLAGFGLTAIGATLAQSQPTTLFTVNFTAGDSDRASLFVWSGTGAGTLTLPTASSAGDGWYINVRNGGGGNLTIDPQGSDEINDESSLVLQPGDSAIVATDGTNFYTVGYGQQAIFAFDYTLISMTGKPTPYTLSGSELNRIAYKFSGTLTADTSVVLPTTTQQYWIDNSTTGGSYVLKIGTLGQTPFLTVPRGSRGIYYCNGSTIVKADTASIATPIAISDGGTGATTAGDALINLGGTSTGIGLFTASSGAVARAALGAAAAGANSDITSLSGLTTPLSVAQGGTGKATITSGAIQKGAGTSAMADATAGTDYAKPDTASTWSAKQTLNGSASALAILLKNASEVVTVSATAATGTINFNLLTQSTLYYTSNAAANWTMNIRGDGSNSLDSLLSTGQSVTCAFLVTEGGTGYYNSTVQIDGSTSGVTTKWLGGAPTDATTSSIEIYTYVVIKTGSATFLVIASRASAT